MFVWVCVWLCVFVFYCLFVYFVQQLLTKRITQPKKKRFCCFFFLLANNIANIKTLNSPSHTVTKMCNNQKSHRKSRIRNKNFSISLKMFFTFFKTFSVVYVLSWLISLFLLNRLISYSTSIHKKPN